MKRQTDAKNSKHDAFDRFYSSATRAFLSAALSLTFPVSLAISNSATVQRSQLRKVPTLVCVVSRVDSSEGTPQGNMDAVVLVENGKFKLPYPDYNEAAQQNFAREYFRVGKKYRVTFGGGEVGTATIKGHHTGCNNIHASATVDDHGRIPAHLSALATTSDSLGQKPASRRAPTDTEREEAMRLVNQVYRSRGTTPALIRTIKTTNLTATDLDGDGKLELIGSFVIETKARWRRDLLLIAEPQGATYKAALVNFQSYKLQDFDSAVDFVDQLDLDGDGVGEVFVQQHGFDAYSYAIYKKANGRWRKVHVATGDAC